MIKLYQLIIFFVDDGQIDWPSLESLNIYVSDDLFDVKLFTVKIHEN